MPCATEPAAADEPTGALPAAPVPKAALVTGGGRRIGRALALALAEDGFAVAVHYHRSRLRPKPWSRRSGAAAARPWRSPPISPTKTRCAACCRRPSGAFGPVGVLVNNAAVFGDDTVATATRASWDRHLAVNLRAPFVLIQDLAARLPAESGGVVDQHARRAGVVADPVSSSPIRCRRPGCGP